jgi:hypothetical protein
MNPRGAAAMPMFEDDWLMSQIRLLAAAIAKVVFRKETVTYEIKDEEDLSDTDELYLYLNTLLESGEINEAEDALFEDMTPGDQSLLLLAVDFYQRLNQLTDDELLLRHFSRAEIYEGLMEAQRIFGIP